MSDVTRTYAISATALDAQSRRLRMISENIANIDTPGFRRKMLSFHEQLDTGGVRVGDVSLDPAQLPKVYDPSHPMADPDGYYEGSNVSLVVEIADAREAQRSYEANLRLFDQARSMSTKMMDILRK